MAWYRIMLDYGNQASLKNPSYIEYVQLKNDKEAKDYVDEIGNDKRNEQYNHVVGGFQKIRKPPREYVEKQIIRLKSDIIDAKTEKDKWEDLMEKFYGKKI